MTARWSIGGSRVLSWEPGLPLVMAIVNVTPDSFSDGGAHATPDAAFEFARECVAAGAAILDVGGESTRPGAASVSADEEVARVVPVIERLRALEGVTISVDTTKVAVARAALDAGATIVNDVSAGEGNPAMFALVAERQCGYALMHRMRLPAEDSYSDRYVQPPMDGDVVTTVREALAMRVRAAVEAGIDPSRIAVDPGLGFGKTVEQNIELMARLDEIVALGHPVLVSASRKSFLGAIAGEPNPARLDAASATAAVAMAARGAGIVRAHDVSGHLGALKVAFALKARAEC